MRICGESQNSLQFCLCPILLVLTNRRQAETTPGYLIPLLTRRYMVCCHLSLIHNINWKKLHSHWALQTHIRIPAGFTDCCLPDYCAVVETYRQRGQIANAINVCSTFIKGLSDKQFTNCESVSSTVRPTPVPMTLPHPPTRQSQFYLSPFEIKLPALSFGLTLIEIPLTNLAYVVHVEWLTDHHTTPSMANWTEEWKYCWTNSLLFEYQPFLLL